MAVSFGDQRTEKEQKIDALVKKRVLTGIELLKEKHGDRFADFIDLKKFDIGDADRCVLGQLYGEGGPDGYAMGLIKLDLDDDLAEQHGFDVEYEAGYTYSHLQAVWVEELTERRTV
jgi:hypothetical protein